MWAIFFLICAGLGYPTLRRYDPRDPRTNFDRSHALYHWQVTGDAAEGPYEPSLVHYRYRLLVPTLARPFYLIGRGHIGTWDPGYFGFLIANSIFCASTALVLLFVARDALGGWAPGLIAPLLYLASFDIPNYQLAGLVDSDEAFAMMALVWCLARGRWSWLPILAVAGALAKETFAPLSTILAAGWVLAERHESHQPSLRVRLSWIVIAALVGLATVAVVFSVANQRLVLPWQLVRLGDVADTTISQRARQLAGDLGLLYTFGWLAPLGVWGLRRCPRPWVAGAAASAATVIALGVYNGEPGVSRSLFTCVGPLLSVASVVTVGRLFQSDWSGGTGYG